MRPVSKPLAHGAPAPKKGGNTLAEIQRLEREREERRKAMEQSKLDRANEEQRNRDAGVPGDVDFIRMIQRFRAEEMPPAQPHLAAEEPMKICIAVRKRPVSSKEVRKHDHDCVSCGNPVVTVHDSKLRIDGISKYLDNVAFEFDQTFGEAETTDDIYAVCIEPLLPFVCRGAGRATVFAYGQTGSGKTYTMVGIQKRIAEDLFSTLADCPSLDVFVSFFEIYGGRCQDLLNERNRLNIREDGGGEVVVGDLTELRAADAEDMLAVIETGNANRTTHATESNDVSSRSHAICQVSLRDPASGKLAGKLSLIDLAGSERGADTMSNNRQRRLEGSEINKSLLALKECIRALDSNSSHVPYRASKLTLVLKDAFTRHAARTVMIACVSPAASSADHTINTLRYADRIKERAVGGQAAANRAPAARERPPAPPRPPLAPGDRKEAKEEEPTDETEEEQAVDELHRTVESLFEEEEELLNLHMNVIQESAELLTEEGRLLQRVQQDDSCMDAYAARLDEILARKQTLVTVLRAKLTSFRECLRREESVSSKVKKMSAY